MHLTRFVDLFSFYFNRATGILFEMTDRGVFSIEIKIILNCCSETNYFHWIWLELKFKKVEQKTRVQMGQSCCKYGKVGLSFWTASCLFYQKLIYWGIENSRWNQNKKMEIWNQKQEYLSSFPFWQYGRDCEIQRKIPAKPTVCVTWERRKKPGVSG